jgi:hypothetical protein
VVDAIAADAREEESAEPQRPGTNQQRQQKRSRIAVSQGDAAGNHRQVGETAREVEVALRLRGVGVDEDQPVEGEAEDAAECEDRDPSDPLSALASSPADGNRNQQDHRYREGNLGSGLAHSLVLAQEAAIRLAGRR